jgi:uncharacterized protein YgiM (DUF1202 family)
MQKIYILVSVCILSLLTTITYANSDPPNSPVQPKNEVEYVTHMPSTVTAHFLDGRLFFIDEKDNTCYQSRNGVYYIIESPTKLLTQIKAEKETDARREIQKQRSLASRNALREQNTSKSMTVQLQKIEQPRLPQAELSLQVTEVTEYSPSVPFVVPPKASAERRIVDTAMLRIRTGPGFEYTSLDMLGHGIQVQVIETQNDWIRVISEDGRTGWMLKRFTRAE